MKMKSLRFKVDRPKPDEVDRAVRGLRSAIGRLARLIVHGDPRVVVKAARALRRVGLYAGGPVASTLSRSPDPRHRLAMLVMLNDIGSGADPDVIEVLVRLGEKDPNPVIKYQARCLLSTLMDRELVASAERSRAEARKKGGVPPLQAGNGPA